MRTAEIQISNAAGDTVFKNRFPCDLAVVETGDALYDLESLGYLVGYEIVLKEFLDRRHIELAVGLENRVYPAAPLGIGDADYDSVEYVQIAQQGVFHFRGEHIFTAGHYHVAAPVGEIEVVLIVNIAHVAHAAEVVALGVQGFSFMYSV